MIAFNCKYDIFVVNRYAVTYHSKMICTNNEAFIGSENLSEVSLMDNREMGLILHNQDNLQVLRDTFNQDWGNSAPLSQ